MELMSITPGKHLCLILLVALACLGVSTCGNTPEFYVTRLEVRQLNWDSLSVSIDFEESVRLGAVQPVNPEIVWTTVFNAAFDTLYHGSDSVIPVRDVDLGDRESILVEVCGSRADRTACEQRTLSASPKRMEAQTELDFPLNEAYDRGLFRMGYRLERQIFGSDSWESFIRRVRPDTYLLAYVEGHEKDAMRIPVRRSNNRLSLSRFAHYRDFRFHIKSRMMDADSASVVFDTYARLGTDPVRISTDRVVLRPKTQEERRSELTELVELTGTRILNEMKGFLGVRTAYVFINEWSYQPLDKTYSSEIELHWRSGFRGEWFDMIGLLTVKSDGTAGRYEWLQGSTSAEDRWNSKMDSTVIYLDALRPGVGLRPPLESESKDERGSVRRMP